MPSVFLVSDTHFGHRGVTWFTHDNGEKIRPWDNVEEMDEALVQNWNSVVGPKDKVYHLGDVVINRRALPTIARLNGDKVLIKGNHDIFRLGEYQEYFRDIRAYHVMDKKILSHIPIHPESKGRFSNNIHGHLHGRRVLTEEKDRADPFYYCVAVENIGFKPMLFEHVLANIKEEERLFS